MKIAVVKYNAGNIYSVNYALKRLGVEATITSDKELLMSADKVIFPGVGEAETTMSHLRKNRLDEVIKNLKQPVLGICLGMQLMCRHSEEGNADCLGIFDTDVKLFSPTRHEDKVPHMGWNTLTHVRSDLFKGFTKEEFVYFVHSFYVPLNDIEQKFGKELWQYCFDMARPHLDCGNLEIYDNNRLCLSRKGIFVSDGIISDLMFVES